MVRPTVNDVPLTPAERQRRRRARIGKAALNRVRRRKYRAKKAAQRRAERAAKAVARQAQETTKLAEAHTKIAVLTSTIRQLTNGNGVQRTRNLTGLTGYTVATITEADALPLILQHEHLGTIGNPTIIVGLFSPEHELEGVACFGNGSTGDIRQRIGSPAFCLERGCCVPHAPKNAASFLITHACKLVLRLTGTTRFFAYADPSAGEYGAVYQAAGWVYLGQGLHGRGQRTHRHAVLPPGADPDVPANWMTTRALRTEGRHLSFAEARAAGWQIAARPAKHVFACNIGRDRKAWLRGIEAKPYPKPLRDAAVTDDGMAEIHVAVERALAEVA